MFPQHAAYYYPTEADIQAARKKWSDAVDRLVKGEADLQQFVDNSEHAKEALDMYVCA